MSQPTINEIQEKPSNQRTLREMCVLALHDLGGEATARQITTHMTNPHAPSARAVAQHLLARKDVEPLPGRPQKYRLDTNGLR